MVYYRPGAYRFGFKTQNPRPPFLSHHQTSNDMGPAPQKYKTGPRVLDFENKKTSYGRCLKPKPAVDSFTDSSKDEPPTKKQKFQQYTDDVPEQVPLPHICLSTTPLVTNSGDNSQLLAQTSESYHGSGSADNDEQFYNPVGYYTTDLPPTVEKLVKGGFDWTLMDAHKGAHVSQGKVGISYPSVY